MFVFVRDIADDKDLLKSRLRDRTMEGQTRGAEMDPRDKEIAKLRFQVVLTVFPRR